MADEKIRLGGMALANGVLVHGPTSWAVRGPRRRTASSRSRRSTSACAPPRSRTRSCAGRPGWPRCSRCCRRCAGACRRRGCRSSGRRCSRRWSATALVVRAIKDSSRLEPARRRAASAGCSRSLRPRSRCAARELAAYHGAEHISIGTLRARRAARPGARALRLAPGRPARRRARRSAARSPPRRRRSCAARPRAAARSARSPPRRRSSAGWCGTRSNPLSRALAWPGHELQHRLATAEPTPEQLEVAEAALAACLELETAADTLAPAAKRLPPEIFDLPVEKMREGYYTDAYFNHTREVLLARRPPPARRDAGLPEAPLRTSAGWTRRSRSSSSAPTTGTTLTVHALYDGDRDRAVGAGADDRGRLHAASRISRPSTSACSRGGR